MRTSDDRLVKWVVLESRKIAEKIGWLVDFGLEGFDWNNVGVEGPGRLSLTEIGHVHAERHCMEKDKEGVKSCSTEMVKVEGDVRTVGH